jgi:hypothetical protein
MRQELIDLLLGELDAAEAEMLKARVRAEPELQRELADLESLFGLMRRGEAVEPAPATREAVVAAASRTRPPLLARLRAIPGLVAYRFRTSVRFRVAVISLGAHLILIAILANILLRPGGPAGPTEITVAWDDAPEESIEPSPELQARLAQRRLPQSTRLRQYGVEGQEEAIATGLEALLAKQRPDGSFGDAAETGYAALALLAQGDCSAQATARGYAVRMASCRILAETKRGEAHGAMLAALVEDFSLSYAFLNEFERMGYRTAIRQLILAVPDDDISREALLLARLAGFAIPAGRDLGDAAMVFDGDRSKLLDLEPTRLRVTAALARGRASPDPDLARAWAAPLFRRALADLGAGKASGVVLLALQAPYRL